MTLKAPVWQADELFVNALTLFDDNWDEGEAVRLLGISVSDFASDEALNGQIDLFDEKIAAEAETQSILKDLNRQIGTKAFVRAGDLLKEKQK